MIEPWMLTYTGKRLDFRYPDIRSIDIEDIATALCRKARFNGQHLGRVQDIYSVAQHSINVHDALVHCYPNHNEPQTRLWALLHDATEAYLPDVHTQLKDMIPSFRELETRIEQVIAGKFRLIMPKPAVIKEIDRRMLATERRDLMPKHGDSWGDLDIVEPFGDLLFIRPIEHVYDMFMQRYIEIVG
jgi:hypothetical protein